MLIHELRKLIQEIKLQEALQKGLKEVEHPFKAFFILGPAGSGKTFIKDAALNLPEGFVSINTDEPIEKVFPKFGLSLKFDEGDVDKKQEVRKLLQQAISDKEKRKINQALPILFDTTGENTNKIKKMIRALISVGYDVAIFMVNVPPDYSVESDTARGELGDRAVGPKRTRAIANNYQKNVVSPSAYAQMEGERGVTILAQNPYPNLFDLRDGSLRPDFDSSVLQDRTLELKDPEGNKSDSMRNPFKGVTWEYAEDILKEARSNLQQWLSDRTPINSTGKQVLEALEYIQDQGIADYGDQITDLFAYATWAGENEKEIPDSVENALQIVFDIDTYQKKVSATTAKDKYPTNPMKVKTAKGEKEVPPELLPKFGQKGAPTIQQLTREQLQALVNSFNNNNKT